ncbi:hypothetical protein [Catenovulum maritimum]|uniref:Uncharacterized protein n=1 Tax=Catenovulum maritimum TaxID=1513271 RepID=A0A0J8GQV5_9ALTE|nr:hypothetical protein [Catenovulum maritimum]KMT65210.1 hypothetical protein XM47_10795 [Catenovulum maritimum]
MKQLKSMLVVVISACVAVLLYQLWPEQQAAVQLPGLIKTKAVETQQPTSVAKTMNNTASEKTPAEILDQANTLDTAEALATQIQMVADKQTEIENLMADLNDNLRDKTKKQEIEQQISQKLTEYNELVLPIALQKMQHNNSQAQ